ncbi:MAG: tetratricopeptide repeat protein [Brevinema sp.]
MTEIIFIVLLIALVSFLLILSVKYIIILPNIEQQIKKNIDEGHLDDAEFLLEKCLEQNPHNITFMVWHAKILWLNQKKELAGMIFEKLYQEHNNHLNKDQKKSVYYYLALWYKEQGSLDLAVKLAEYLVVFDDYEKPVEYLNLMGEILLKQNDSYKALTYFQQIYAIEPNNIKVLKQIAEILYDLNDFPESLKMYTLFAQKESTNGEAWFRMGEISEKLNNINKAISFYTKAELYGDPNTSCKATYQNAKLYVDLEKTQEAVAALEKAVFKLKSDKKNIIDKSLKLSVFYYLAQIFENDYRINSALDLWEDIKKIDPYYRDIKQKINQYSTAQLNDFFIEMMTNSGANLADILCEFINTLKYTIDSYNFLSEECVQIIVYEISSKWRDIKRRKILFIFWASDRMFPADIINKIYNNISYSGTEKIIVITAGPILSETRTLMQNKSIYFYDKNNIKDLINERREKDTNEY